ncbi:uncharacterized protein ColSpa_12026 [Colletotrichum spaethianum]|uniref:SMP-30/Gluconolactonase/LRE-like region domain-containing protein n=1 Tax=Colletotrichum spaethianum TaxID=700344 RepID=A0AA37PGF0_9PEZI|nr:uncharacterized protein ColSpa_12026 [Colletotrichum spaethianum]GKT51845.1 hypothetical protein ColSpa_12026 [Colletotrichum spaethianum]
MFPSIFRLWPAALLFPAVLSLSVEITQDFPLGSEVENLALRPSGSALATVYTFPYLYEVDVSQYSTPKLLHTFTNTSGACGIAASSETDVYFVLTGNFSFQSFTPVPGSYAIHRLSFSECGKPIVKELAPLGDISQPNGMIAVPNTPYVLIADNRGGFVYRFNTETLELTIYFDDPLLKPNSTAGVLFGVNGVKLSQGFFYFSNTNQQIVARIKATGEESRLEGTSEIVAFETIVDDFIVDDVTGDLYVAEQGNNALGLVRRDAYGSKPKTIVGGPGSTTLLAPTAAIWAKDAVGRTLIISVTGGFEQFYTQVYTGGARLALINL